MWQLFCWSHMLRKRGGNSVLCPHSGSSRTAPRLLHTFVREFEPTFIYKYGSMEHSTFTHFPGNIQKNKWKTRGRKLMLGWKSLTQFGSQCECFAACGNLTEKSCTQHRGVAPLFANPRGLAQVGGRVWVPGECLQPVPAAPQPALL